ncbi:cation transporter/ATPase N-terminal domain protein, partial [Bordetella bronchiseptica 980-2]
MRRIASDDVAAAMARMGSREGVLSAAEVHERRTRFGPNEVEHEKPLPGWLHLWHCYRNPFNLLLSVLAGI